MSHCTRGRGNTPGHAAFMLGLVAVLLHVASSCGPAAVRPAPVTTSTAPAADASYGTAPAPGTAGTIQCGNDRCKVGEQRCCPFPQRRCVPLDEQCTPPETDACNEDWCGEWHLGLECDGHDDCPGELCCLSGYEATSVSCEKDCGSYEVCTAGGTCSPGLVCEPSTWSMTGSLCNPSVKGATCGNKRCPADRPYCCLGDPGDDKRCVEEAAGCADDERNPQMGFACTTAADCGGYDCCVGMHGAVCVANCRIDQQGAICQKGSDCPQYPPHELIGCVPQPGFPFSTCQYRLVG